jgi:hypothetical protein
MGLDRPSPRDRIAIRQATRWPFDCSLFVYSCCSPDQAMTSIADRRLIGSVRNLKGDIGRIARTGPDHASRSPSLRRRSRPATGGGGPRQCRGQHALGLFNLQQAHLPACGTIANFANCDDYDDIIDWGNAHLSLLRGLAEFHGIPCTDWPQR